MHGRMTVKVCPVSKNVRRMINPASTNAYASITAAGETKNALLTAYAIKTANSTKRTNAF